MAISASYQASYGGFERAGLDADTAARLIRRSVSLAQSARDAVRPEDGLVAASPIRRCAPAPSRWTWTWIGSRSLANSARLSIVPRLPAGGRRAWGGLRL